MEDAVSPQVSSANVVVRSMAGEDVLLITPVPATVFDLKKDIADRGYMAVALQKLMREEDYVVCNDEDILEDVDQVMILVEDDTPLWFWDKSGNPSAEQLEIDGGILKCPALRTDYTNVLTQEPISSGLHYFEFHIHHYGDEQWCGLTPDKNMAGPEYDKAIPSKNGYCYYAGRGKGALEAMGRHLKDVEYIGRSDNVIGMLVDCDNGAAAFDLNSKIQGACEISARTPLWVITHVDTNRDHVELRKSSLSDAPPANLDALKGALLEISNGTVMDRRY